MSGVLLTECAMRQLAKHAPQAADGNETGGILLGDDHGIAGGFVIQQCGDPGPAAVRTPTHFLRDLDHARQLAAEALSADGSTWIGEWHTHPTSSPMLSHYDIATCRSLLGNAELHFPRILSLIVTPERDNDWTGIRLYAWSCSGYNTRRLRIALPLLTGR